MIDLDHIRIFLAVAEQRSFVAAARQLSMTAPTVTRAVSSLEDQLGIQLLLRTTRHVSLTSAGAVYAARIAPLLDTFQQVNDELREQHGDVAGLIRINAPMSLGQQILPDVASGFRVDYPRTVLSLTLTDRFIDIVSDDYDLAIRISEAPRDKSTIWRKICPVRRIIVASPGYIAAYGLPETPDDLERHSCLAYDERSTGESWELRCEGKSRKIRAGQTIAGNNGELMARLAANGEGIALLPHFIVEEALRGGQLQRLLPDWSPPELWLTLYYPPYERLPMRVAKFSDFFETYVTRTRPL
ncbi:DNA-binding transcriptional LysR family regulator [Breoghania corrubedonensis]|uniref:DNA-binding transcriptional LysR family regulator n=1 Tax=Breoghania corrubedonensis TaxID=665038 RepID=A0A2T5UW19_9HYPH|nr:LysR family transcriptional regulator [Breoghania corrubedonensis]PTW55688.1 DNA-binding transcriptional LysR family regulator [Breoghania corrubedonensis]